MKSVNLLRKKNAWLLKLATGVKRKVTELVKDNRLGFNDMDTSVNLNILPLVSYDILIGIDQLESHKSSIDCLHKISGCVDEEGKYHMMKGNYIPIST